MTFHSARTNPHALSRVRDGSASGHAGGDDLLLARSRWPRQSAAQVPVSHANRSAAASHSSRPSIDIVPRVRCRRCGRTAALLPWFVTPYRWDTVDVIGRALELAVGGQGVRRIAAAVRVGWSGFDLPVAPGSRCLAAADVLATAWARHHGPVLSWRLAVLVTGGAWLAPNTGSPLASPGISPVMTGTPGHGGDRWHTWPSSRLARQATPTGRDRRHFSFSTARHTLARHYGRL